MITISFFNLNLGDLGNNDVRIQFETVDCALKFLQTIMLFNERIATHIGFYFVKEDDEK